MQEHRPFSILPAKLDFCYWSKRKTSKKFHGHTYVHPNSSAQHVNHKKSSALSVCYIFHSQITERELFFQHSKNTTGSRLPFMKNISRSGCKNQLKAPKILVQPSALIFLQELQGCVILKKNSSYIQNFLVSST